MKVQTVRRLVTGHDENGKSRIIMDGPAESVLVMEKMGDLTVTDFWEPLERRRETPEMRTMPTVPFT